MKYVEILLVEDDPGDAELTLRTLKKNHTVNKITHVADGEDALNYIYRKGNYQNLEASGLPRLIILDLNLPKINGLEVLRTLKSDPDTQNIPIVVMTSSKRDSDLLESYNLGVNSFLLKPFDFNEFTKTVSTIAYYWILLNEMEDQNSNLY
ncbi:MAG: response regulator [Bacteroidia bacterium]